MLIDSHCHLYIDRPQEEIPPVLERARVEGVEALICPAIDLASAETCIHLAQKFEMVHAAAGIHPNYTAEATEDDLPQLRKLLSRPGIVALGEIGLDYYREYAPFDLQRKWFQSQLELASELGLPVIVHNRNADEDVLNLIRSVGVTRGVAHCFSSDQATAEAFLELGFYISFAGNLTFKNSPLPEVARRLPMDRILVETDTPYLSPVPFRGKPNEPARVRLVAEKLAEIHTLPLKAVAKITSENTRKVFSF
jgi:TatD DNase family protein